MTGQAPPGRGTRAALYSLVILSGAAGLVYEVVWARQLTLFIGNTAVANAAVLTAFMLGLALGSLALGRLADRLRQPLKLYALLEILIGIYGASTPWLFDALQIAYADVAGLVGVSGAWSHLPRFGAAVIAMFVPTFLMGGTLPLLIRFFSRRLDRAQTVTSRLYGINTLGATAGTFAAGFFLLPAFGITRTLLIAAIINVAVGLCVFALLRGQFGAAAPESLPSKDGQRASISGEAPLAHPGLLLIGFALSGFAALLYQVVWIHALILVIGVSVYAFSTVVTVYLAGIGIGSLLVGPFVRDRSMSQLLKLAFALQLGIALSAVAGLGFIDDLPVQFVRGWAALNERFALFQAYMFLLSGLIIIVPTVLLGALFPLISGVWSRHQGAVGRGIGEAYGANALGTIAGSAVGGLFILDWLGFQGSLYLASGVSGAVAALFWTIANPRRSLAYRCSQWPVAAMVVTASIVLLPGFDYRMLQTDAFRDPGRFSGADPRSRMREYLDTVAFDYYAEGIHGTVSVFGWERAGKRRKALMTNGKVDASTNTDITTQVLLGQIPMFVHGKARNAMVIGLGSGMTAGTMLRTPSAERVDILEIAPEVVEAAAYFAEDNHGVLDDPRASVIIADARNYMLASDGQYDVIVSEPSHSWVTGVSNLFTREFLELARARLKPGGVLAQWYHLYGVDRGSLKALLKAVTEVFAHYTIWYVKGGDIIITASSGPLEFDYSAAVAYFDALGEESDLSRIGVASVEQLMTYVMMSSEEVGDLLIGTNSNTDDHPVVEFSAPRHLYRFTTSDNIRMLFGELDEGTFPLPIRGLVTRREGWLSIPFMGIWLFAGESDWERPQWNAVRTSLDSSQKDRHRLMGGMTGKVILRGPTGDLAVHATMAAHVVPDKDILYPMMDSAVPRGREAIGGELRAAEEVVYWRAANAPTPGQVKVVLARRCARRSGFDSFVAVTTTASGTTQDRHQTGEAVQRINRLLRCLGN